MESQENIKKQLVDSHNEIEMKNLMELPLHHSIDLKVKDNNFLVVAVPGGWLYTINGKTSKSTTFVPYPIQPELMEVKDIDSQKPIEVIIISRPEEIIESVDPKLTPTYVEVKPDTNTTKTENESEINLIIHWSDNKNSAEKSKHYTFNNQKHYENWYKKWISLGNKIIGEYSCDKNGNLLKNEN